MIIKQETLDLLAQSGKSSAEDHVLFNAVLASDNRDAKTLIEAVISTKKFPWVSLSNKNCCAAVAHYYRGESDYAKHAALSMLKIAAVGVGTPSPCSVD